MSKRSLEVRRHVWVVFENDEYNIAIGKDVNCVGALLDEISERFDVNQTMYSLQVPNRDLTPRTELITLDLVNIVFNLVKRETENVQLPTVPHIVPNSSNSSQTTMSPRTIPLHKTITENTTFPHIFPNSSNSSQTTMSRTIPLHKTITENTTFPHIVPNSSNPSQTTMSPHIIPLHKTITGNTTFPHIVPNSSNPSQITMSSHTIPLHKTMTGNTTFPQIFPSSFNFSQITMSPRTLPLHKAITESTTVSLEHNNALFESGLGDSVDTSVVETTDDLSDDEEEDKREESLDKSSSERDLEKSSERDLEERPYKNLINVIIKTVTQSHEKTGVMWFTTYYFKTPRPEETSLLAITWNQFQKYFSHVQNIPEISIPELVKLFEFDENDEKCNGKGWVEVDRDHDYVKNFGVSFSNHQFDVLYTYKPWWYKNGITPPSSCDCQEKVTNSRLTK